MYPSVDKIVLVTDDLNTHEAGALYEVFCAEEVHRFLNRFVWHYTPDHGSWFDMAEVEIGVMCRQVLGVAFADVESFKNQVRTCIQ